MPKKAGAGKRLGPYELHGEIGRGAMAIVWRAHDPRLDRDVAIKEPVLPQGLKPKVKQDLAARFIREGKAAAQLNHPGIVTVYSAEILDGRPCIVMELIDGVPLSARIGQPAAVEQVISIVDQLLDAVASAHAKGVIHRDIKPDNVFVTKEGRVKLTDFGIARLGTSTQLTQPGTLMGTPGYMAPEQVVGGAVDGRADLFAVGVIAYELLTGGNPFGASGEATPTTVMYRIVHEEPADLSIMAPASDVPEHLRLTINTALAKSPDWRFPDAIAMRRAWRGEGPATVTTAAGAAPAWQALSTPPPAASGDRRGTVRYVAVAVGVPLLLAAAILALNATRRPVGVPDSSSGSIEVPTSTPPPPSRIPTLSRSASYALLKANYAKIGTWDVAISSLVDEFNAEPVAEYGASAGVTARAGAITRAITRDLKRFRDRPLKVASDYASDEARIAQLYDLLRRRANAIYEACIVSPGTSAVLSRLADGHVARVQFDSLYPISQPAP